MLISGVVTITTNPTVLYSAGRPTELTISQISGQEVRLGDSNVAVSGPTQGVSIATVSRYTLGRGDVLYGIAPASTSNVAFIAVD